MDVAQLKAIAMSKFKEFCGHDHVRVGTIPPGLITTGLVGLVAFPALDEEKMLPYLIYIDPKGNLKGISTNYQT